MRRSTRARRKPARRRYACDRRACEPRPARGERPGAGGCAPACRSRRVRRVPGGAAAGDAGRPDRGPNGLSAAGPAGAGCGSAGPQCRSPFRAPLVDWLKAPARRDAALNEVRLWIVGSETLWTTRKIGLRAAFTPSVIGVAGWAFVAGGIVRYALLSMRASPPDGGSRNRAPSSSRWR
jgi:hypothetical protein